jgi:hypothetical protein
MSLSRRSFVENGAVLAAVAAAAGAISFPAWSDSTPLLSDSDPAATALGYKGDATTVDKSKYPQYAAGQTCSNCALYSGPAGSASGACPLFAGKAVAAKGWCMSYAKKG